MQAVKSHTHKPVITKLSPNVTDITEIARAVEAAGTDAISLINTLVGMKIDIQKKRPVLGNIVGAFRARRCTRWPCAWCTRWPRP